MSGKRGVKRLVNLFILGFISALTGYIFTVFYLHVMWEYSDPRWGIPFFWFIPHGVKGLHFHHDLELFIIAPVMAWLARRGKVPRDAAFVVTAFFFGMALHHWYTEGLRLITVDL